MDTYSYAQRRSVATIGLLADFALYLISRDPSRHKVVLFDEAWFLLASGQGRNLLNRLMRLGRAQNATVIVATQRLGDLGELTDLIGTYFIFGQHSDEEARRGLTLLGLDATNESDVAKVRQYERGLGLMKDLRGRVAEIQIDVAFPEVMETLDTSTAAAERRRIAGEEAEELAAAEQEEELSEDGEYELEDYEDDDYEGGEDEEIEYEYEYVYEDEEDGETALEPEPAGEPEPEPEPQPQPVADLHSGYEPPYEPEPVAGNGHFDPEEDVAEAEDPTDDELPREPLPSERLERRSA